MRQEHHLPKTMNYMTMSIDDILGVTARLSDLLSEETELLTRMKVRDIKPLQAEKQKLSYQLTSFQKQLIADDRAVKEASEPKREALATLSSDLAVAIEKNMERTVIAQAVNQRVLKTLMTAMTIQQQPNVYGSNGLQAVPPAVTISVNLNEKA